MGGGGPALPSMFPFQVLLVERGLPPSRASASVLLQLPRQWNLTNPVLKYLWKCTPVRFCNLDNSSGDFPSPTAKRRGKTEGFACFLLRSMTQGTKRGEMCRQSTAAGQVLGKQHIERVELGPGHAAETSSRGKNMFPGERQGAGAGRAANVHSGLLASDACLWRASREGGEASASLRVGQDNEGCLMSPVCSEKSLMGRISPTRVWGVRTRLHSVEQHGMLLTGLNWDAGAALPFAASNAHIHPEKTLDVKMC